jgi:sulfur-carrier protein adenylyltransferase/sulfurtransferase
VTEDTERQPALDDAELQRYARQVTLPQVGVGGQLRLRAARVLVVGAGGLGSPAALYLAAAGIGTLGIVDHDQVELTNLHRQLLHGTGDIGRPKVDSARDRLAQVNPHVRVVPHHLRLTSDNAMEVLRGYDVVLDGTDNFATRYLINDACVLLGIPNVHGAIFRFDGQVSVFATPDGPCYRCLFPTPPAPGSVADCATAGVLGALPGLVGTIQAVEAIKLLLGIGQPLAGRLLLIATLEMSFRTVRVTRDPQCPACGTRQLRQLIDYQAFCGQPPATTMHHDEEMTPATLAERLRDGPPLELIDVREQNEYDFARIPGARLVPLAELPALLPDLDPSREYVIMCRSGARSGRAVAFMRQHGFSNVHNLAGGILRWSDDVDPSVPRY